MIFNRFPKKVVRLIALFLVGVISTSLWLNVPQITQAQAPNSCGEIKTPLTPEEEKYARAAWQYFVNNYQQETGFANAANGYPSGTLWDLGNYLMALNAVRWLNFIPQAEFDSRFNKFLTTLSKLKLFEDSIPNKVYHTAKAEMVDYTNKTVEKGIGWSALDLGRILAAFHAIGVCHPQYKDWMKGILASWAIPRTLKDGQLFGALVKSDGQTMLVQEGRLGYEEYAARGFELWGFKAEKALSWEPFKFADVEGVQIPVDTRDYQTTNANNYVVSESYILDGIEFGLKEDITEYSARVFEAQKRRFEKTGQLTAVSEDNIDKAPYFLYNTVYANGNNWATITEKNELHPELSTISTKAAFGWRYIYPNSDYAKKVFDAVKDKTFSPKGDGFYAGIYEKTNLPNAILTGNTNGLIVEILYYKARGNRPLIGYDLVTASTGKPEGEDYTAPVLTAAGATSAATSAPPPASSSNNQQLPPPPANTTPPPANTAPPPANTAPPPTNTAPPPTNNDVAFVSPPQINIEPIAKLKPSDSSSCPKLVRSLTVAEKRRAEAAWQYFESNYQKNTGVVNDRPEIDGITLWGVGDYLAALNAAKAIEVLSAEDFDLRARKLLAALQRIPLFAGQLPYRSYDSQTLQPVDYGGNPTVEGTGWSGLDIARVMGAMYNLKNCHPEYTKAVDEILLQWSYSQVVRNNVILSAEIDKDSNGRIMTLVQPENRFGYEEYAARIFQLWGFNVDKAAVGNEYQAVSVEKLTVPVYRQTKSQNEYLESSPFLRYGLEFGFDPQMRQIVEPILKVQSERYRNTGMLTAAATTLINRSPYILHNTIFGWDKPWTTQAADGKSVPESRIVSTAVAFAFYALFPDNEYTRLLWESTVDLYDPILGYYEGFYEKTGKREPSLSSSTNSIVLQSILYGLIDRQPIIRPDTAMKSPWWQAVAKGDLGKGLPEKAKQTARLMADKASSYWVSDNQYVEFKIGDAETTTTIFQSVPQSDKPADLVLSSSNSPPTSAPQTQEPNKENPPNPNTSLLVSLTESDRLAAQWAWKYIERNWNAQTGFVNAVENYPWTTWWDQGSAIFAFHAARKLGLINPEQFNTKIDRLIATLEKMPLSSTGLPNKAYSTQTAQMRTLDNKPDPQGKSGWSALDTARFLLSLHALKSQYPEKSDRIDRLARKWKLEKLVNNGSLQGGVINKQGKLETFQEGRLGYEQYAAYSLKTWGLEAKKALLEPPVKTVSIEGISLQVDLRDRQNSDASNYLTNDPYLLWGLELGWSDTVKPQVLNLLRSQEKRFQRTKILTAVNEDSLDRPPYFLYYSIYADGQSWSILDIRGKSYPQLRFLSTKAAFAWSALMPEDPYAQTLRQKVEKVGEPSLGYFTGIYEQSKLGVNQVLNINTNAIILESLLYQAQNQFPLALSNVS